MPERLACTTKMSTILYKDTDRTFTFLYFFNYILITQLITPQHSFPSTKLHTSLEFFFQFLQYEVNTLTNLKQSTNSTSRYKKMLMYPC